MPSYRRAPWSRSVYGYLSHGILHIRNTAACVVTLPRKSCHITPILKELHLLIVHKSFNNIAPIYISELLKVYTPSRNLRSSNMSLLKEPTSKRTWGGRSFSVAAPRLWNHLPTKLESCQSITRFKSLLKSHLMSQFSKMMYNICNCIAMYIYLGTYFVLCYHSKLFVFMCLLCFSALSTQQGGYVRSTNLYYHYYYYYDALTSFPIVGPL